MTARLAIHPDVAPRASDVLERLAAAGVDVEVVSFGSGAGPGVVDPLKGVHDRTLDLALVGLRALRGSADDDLTTVAVLPRQELRDVLVTLGGEPAPLAGMRIGARVGIFGARRLAFLKVHRPRRGRPFHSHPEAGGA